MARSSRKQTDDVAFETKVRVRFSWRTLIGLFLIFALAVVLVVAL